MKALKVLDVVLDFVAIVALVALAFVGLMLFGGCAASPEPSCYVTQHAPSASGKTVLVHYPMACGSIFGDGI